MAAASSPKTSTSRSEQPLMTAGVSLKPGAQLTMPRTLTIERTRASEPSSARSDERVALIRPPAFVISTRAAASSGEVLPSP